MRYCRKPKFVIPWRWIEIVLFDIIIASTLISKKKFTGKRQNFVNLHQFASEVKIAHSQTKQNLELQSLLSR